MSNPVFGSPEWDAKYGVKKFQKGDEKKSGPVSVATKAKKKKHGRGRIRAKKKNFIAGAIKHPGALHAELGVPQGQKIPAAQLAAAAKALGKEGQRARFALMLAKLNKG